MKKNYTSFPRVLICAFSLWVLSSSVFAQGTPVFSASIISAAQDDNIKVEVSVSDFEDVVSIQFSLRYDSTVLKALSVGDFGLPYMGSTNIAIAPLQTEGIIAFSWYDESLSGQNLSDGTVIFSVTLKVVGEPSSETALSFSNEPVLIEVTNSGGEVLEPTFVDGSVMVLPSSASEWMAIEGAVLHPVIPNPMQGSQSQALLHLDRSSSVQLRVFDIIGRQVYSEAYKLFPGVHSIPMERSWFPGAGVYTLHWLLDGAPMGSQRIVIP